jgi:hypothetical protein
MDLQTSAIDTPTFRLEQRISDGSPHYMWDVAGNEENFFLRDATSGTLPLSVAAGAPSSSLAVDSSGWVGIGTSDPTAPVHLTTTGGQNAQIQLTRTEIGMPDSVGIFSAAKVLFTIGSLSDHPLQFVTGDPGSGGATFGWRMKLYQDNSLRMRSGATCTPGGVWTNAASLTVQQNVRQLGTGEALQALNGLEPVRFSYKADPGREHIGFTAEQAPDMLVTDGTEMSPMDVTAVLTKVVKHQQEVIRSQRNSLVAQERRLRALEEAVGLQ